jgi:SAM-dependent methyltransferase
VHDSVRAFVAAHTTGRRTGRVLEVGACNVNGSVRDLFGSSKYVGVDHQEGPGVDIVADAHDLDCLFRPRAFDLVLCLEMLEHDPAPWLTMPQLGRVLRRRGTLLLTTRSTGFPEHNNPDYWRFMRDGMELLLGMTGCRTVDLVEDPEAAGWHAYCVKEA